MLEELRSTASFPVFRTNGDKPKGPVENILSIFADVRAGEGAGALLLMVNVFLLLGAYYLLKTAREPLILTEGGAAVKAYSAAGQAIVLMILVPLYGLIGTRVKRLTLVSGLSLFFATHLVVFRILGAFGVHIGVAYYIWVGVFNLFVVSQFWAFANDLYTESQGKRLFPMIGVGASVGALAGSQAATSLFKDFHITPYVLMSLGCAILLITTLLTRLANRIETRRAGQSKGAQEHETLGAQDGFALIFRDRYLLLIAGLIVVLNVVNTTGEFLLSSVVEQEAIRQFAGNKAAMQGFIGAFYGDYFRWVNLLGIVFQALLVSRIFNKIGVRGAVFVLPCIALASYSVLALAPILAVVRGVKTLENATDYSLQNTIRAALFLPTSREAKYKAKAAIDTFFTRFGDVLQAGVVKVGLSLSASLAVFAWFNAALTIVWLWIAFRLYQYNRRVGL